MCRVRIYFPDAERDAVVVIYSEIPANRGTSVTSAAEIIAASVMSAHELTKPPLFIEHYPPEATDGQAELFELVLFDSYELRRRRASYAGDEALTIGEPTWKEIDRRTVETLVGQEVQGENVLRLVPCSHKRYATWQMRHLMQPDYHARLRE